MYELPNNARKHNLRCLVLELLYKKEKIQELDMEEGKKA